MKGGFGCSPCCGPTCDECTRTCTNPHTGTAFEVVYSYKFAGVEAGNPTDGYLEATGDADSSDPYDGMDGNGPWEQKVSLGVELTSSTTRHPCNVNVSFWRSNFVLGAATNLPPSAALTLNEIKITNTGTSADGPVTVEGQVLNPGEQIIFEGRIPLVAGSGDQSANDPRSGNGTVFFTQVCGNQRAKVNITATIRWTTQKRQHILYGIVRECYEDPENPPECGSPCSAQNPPPDVMYVTISNVAFAKPAGAGVEYDWLDDPVTHTIEGTYVIERVANLCTYYEGPIPFECPPSIAYPPLATGGLRVVFDGQGLDSEVSNYWALQTSAGSKCELLKLVIADAGTFTARQNCGTLPITGSGSSIYRRNPDSPSVGGNVPESPIGTFSWSIDD